MQKFKSSIFTRGMWPTICNGTCDDCGCDIEVGDGVYVSSEYEENYRDNNVKRGLWCPDCYIGRDLITRCA